MALREKMKARLDLTIDKSNHKGGFNPSRTSITLESQIKVRKKKVITNWRNSWLLHKFSSSAPWEAYREQWGEFV